MCVMQMDDQKKCAKKFKLERQCVTLHIINRSHEGQYKLKIKTKF